MFHKIIHALIIFLCLWFDFNDFIVVFPLNLRTRLLVSLNGLVLCLFLQNLWHSLAQKCSERPKFNQKKYFFLCSSNWKRHAHIGFHVTNSRRRLSAHRCGLGWENLKQIVRGRRWTAHVQLAPLWPALAPILCVSREIRMLREQSGEKESWIPGSHTRPTVVRQTQCDEKKNRICINEKIGKLWHRLQLI